MTVQMRNLSALDRLVLRVSLLTTKTRSSPMFLAYISATVLIVGTEILRVLFQGGLEVDLPANQYLPFYFMVLLCSWFLDHRSGIFATCLAAVVSSAVKGPIPGSIELKIMAWPTFGFVVTGLVMAITIESLNHLADRFKVVADRNEVLIRDLNHRVKNHLATMAGLVNLSKRNMKISRDEALDSVSSRLMVLARLYDRLKLDSDNATIQVQASEFIPAVCQELTDTLVGARSIRIDSTVDPAFITTAKAVPVGLLVNELVTNSIKHAFPDGEGDIHVSLHAQGDGYELKVCDGGIGGERGHSNTGSRLVQMLVKQLNGTVDISYDSGRCTTILLPSSLALRQ